MTCKARHGFWGISQQLWRDDRGATLVLMALTTTVLLAITGFGVDVGWWYTIQRQNQSAADAGALSAAYELLPNPTWTAAQLTPFASQAAAQNGYAGTTPAVTYPCGSPPCLAQNSGGIQVVLQQPQSTWFAALTGLNSVTIANRAVARVTVLELLPQVLYKEDPEAGQLVLERLAAEGITILTGFRATEVRREGASKVVFAEDGRRVAVDELFVAAGRRPDAAGVEPESAGVELDDGAVRVNARLETTARGIWAAGDVTGGPQFTHLADYMARVVVQNALTPLKRRVSYRVVPRVTFTDPEVAHVGLTAGDAAALGERAEVHRADFGDLDRAIVDGATAGFCKVVTRRNGTILGATIVGRGAGEVIMELVLAMRYGVPLGRLASAIHPYPTRGEIVKRTADGWLRARFGDTRRGRLLRGLIRWWL